MFKLNLDSPSALLHHSLKQGRCQPEFFKLSLSFHFMNIYKTAFIFYSKIFCLHVVGTVFAFILQCIRKNVLKGIYFSIMGKYNFLKQMLTFRNAR